MAKVKTRFVCQNCGYINPKWLGKCPECLKWNTFLEEIEEKKVSSNSSGGSLTVSKSKVIKINSIEIEKEDRYLTSISELDRVLGGGIIPGSMILVGGDPGIGKSTLMLQVSNNIAKTGKKVIYISGEENENQIKMRAKRLNADSENLYIYTETNLAAIELVIMEMKPDVIIVDSIQTVIDPEINSAPGTVSQIKESTSKFMKISKGNKITSFIVGHVTKEGALAGPRVLEHMVDTVLYFEGERYNTYRLLRSVKNRFGSTNELGVFEMKSDGLYELINPSKVLISEKPKGVSGSVILSTLEGTRSMLLELQALVAPTNFGYPRRTTTGVDNNRVALILAVLEKVVGMQIQNQDVFVNIVGGLKTNEPSMDLGIGLAIASSFRNIPIDSGVVVTGEIGLTGEIRTVSFIEKRINECQKLGFSKILIPYGNYTDSFEEDYDIEIVPVKTLKQAISIAFNS